MDIDFVQVYIGIRIIIFVNAKRTCSRKVLYSNYKFEMQWDHQI